MQQTKRRALHLIVCLALVGVAAIFLTNQKAQGALPGAAKARPESFARLVDEVKHSVVNVSTT